MRAWLALAALLGGCPAPASTECGNDLYCPDHTICSGTGGGVCVVAPGSCELFQGRSPCFASFGNGHCTDGECTRGVRIGGKVAESPTFEVVSGLRVGVLDHPEIIPTETGDGGGFLVEGVPELAPVVMTFDEPGFVPGLSRWIHTDEGDFNLDDDPSGGGEQIMIRAERVAELATATEVVLDPDRGILAGRIYSGDADMGLGGARVQASPPCGTTAVYIDTMGRPVIDGEASIAGSGAFFFANCPPGDVALAVEHPTLTSCGVREPAGVSAEIDAPIRALTFTFAGRIECRSE